MLRDRLRRPVSVDRAAALAQAISARAYRLDSTEDLSPLIEWIGDARFVLLGEASHGTSEYVISSTTGT